MEFKQRFQKIKQVTVTKPYIYYFIAIFFIYIIINIFTNKLYIVAPVILSYNLKIIIPFMILGLLIAILVPININLIILKFKQIKQLNKESGLSFLGVFGGLLGGACPSCFVGVFPAFLGLFGITASLSSLPFFGIEILIGSAIFLIIAIIFLTKDNVCKIK